MPSGVVSRRRNWLSFSLRTFLLVNLFMGVCLGVVGIIVLRARRQREAVDEVQRLGGTVMYDHHEVDPRMWSTVGKPPGPKWLRRLLGPEYFDRPNYVSLVTPPAPEGWERVSVP